MLIHESRFTADRGNEETVQAGAYRRLRQEAPVGVPVFGEQWRFLVRVNYYGEYYDNEAGGEFDDATVIDLEVGFAANENIDFTVGARNVGDETGCSTRSCGVTPPGILGLPSSQFSPFGFNGAFYYGKMTYNFAE